MKAPQVHLPSEIEIKITPGADGSAQGQAVLRAYEWVAVPQSQLDLKIIPTRGDVHYDQNGSFTIAITLAAQIQKPKPPPDPPLIIMP